MFDCTYRVQVPHRSGKLAQVMGAIAEGEGLIGDIVTISVGRESSIREITVEVRDLEVAEHISGLIEAVEGTRVLWHQDRALIRHEGGKLQIDAVHRVSSVQEMRDVYSREWLGSARRSLRNPSSPGALRDDLSKRRHLHQRDASARPRQHRTCRVDACDGSQGRLLPAVRRQLGDAGFDRHRGHRRVRCDGGPDCADIRRDHLEDISAPECFEIERRLIESLPQPVMHDDVHGTAVVAVAAALVACRHAGIELRAATVGQLGLGAAGFGSPL